MTTFSSIERKKLERLLVMGTGWVLDFSDRTFAEFFREHGNVNIDDEKYRVGGSSKANRMRTFWAVEGDHLVAQVIDALIEYGTEYNLLPDEPGLLHDAQRVTVRLKESSPIDDVDAFTATVMALDFEAAAKHIKEALRANEPATALDRAHVFMMKLLRTVCTKHGIEVTRDKAMHSLMGEYVKRMRQAGHLESVMTERILKTSISTFEAFNEVRNNQSLAHDNAILNHDEAVLIFAHVAASIRFINALEHRIKPGVA